MRVLKFGGTSVGTPESLLNVKNIVENINEPVIVVVSALGGLTDRLIATANNARDGKEWKSDWDAMVERHHNIIRQVVPDNMQDATVETVDNLLNDLARNYEGIQLLGQLPPQTLDLIVSFGERMSAPIVAAMIHDARLHYSPDFIKTERWFDRNIADVPLTEECILKEFPAGSVRREVTGGFISSDRESGIITNLGRGGSDYTAALIAAALDASVLDIWTDVDGFLTTDPRIVPSARIIDEMSFVESMELCSFGAKVIYPPTIYPVFHKNIPIRILNTFNPQAPGTRITDTPAPAKGIVRGLSALRNMALLTIRGNLSADIPQMTSRSFNALAREGIPMLLLTQENDELRYSCAVASADSQNALKALEKEFAPDLLAGGLEEIHADDSLAIVAVVGDNMRDARGISARMTHTLRRNGIHPLAASEESSKTTVSVVIKEEEVQQTLRILHDLFFSSPEF
ncbi:MAG: aspartate kinase [Bacteroides sp.]|nr:aspartate kinase [Bacteroides sp.]